MNIGEVTHQDGQGMNGMNESRKSNPSLNDESNTTEDEWNQRMWATQCRINQLHDNNHRKMIAVEWEQQARLDHIEKAIVAVLEESVRQKKRIDKLEKAEKEAAITLVDMNKMHIDKQEWGMDN